MSDLPQRLYQTKLTLLAVLFVVAGIGLLVLAHDSHASLLRLLPVSDIGSGLFTTGLIGVALQYLDARDADERASERLRRVLTDTAPQIRDSVIDAFAFSPEALTAVTSPEVIDHVIQNCLAEQLSDPQLADELRHRLLTSAMTLGDRRSDTRLSVSLGKGPSRELLRVTVRRSYRFIPPPIGSLRFASVASRDEYDTLLRDPESAEVWRMRIQDGLDAGDEAAFALTSVELDGETLPFKRSTRKGAQVFSTRLPQTDDPSAVRHLAYSFDLLVPRTKHCLFFDFARPTLGLEVELDYDDSLHELRLLDCLGQQTDLRHGHHQGDTGDGELTLATEQWVVPAASVIAIWK